MTDDERNNRLAAKCADALIAIMIITIAVFIWWLCGGLS